MSPLLLVAGSMAVIGALGVVLSRAPVHSVVALILNLIGLAGLYLALHAEFLAVVQVIVYAGAVMILFLFVIALLTVKREPLERGRLAGGARTVVPAAAAGLVAVLIAFAVTRPDALTAQSSVPDRFGTAAVFGRELFVTHVLAFEAAALILLVALVGVVVLVGRGHSKGRE